MRNYSVRKRVLVTGGAGFLGSHLVEQSISHGDETICVDNLAYPAGPIYDQHDLKQRRPKIRGRGVRKTINYFDKKSVRVGFLMTNCSKLGFIPAHALIPVEPEAGGQDHAY